jgi:hypothetical protein
MLELPGIDFKSLPIRGLQKVRDLDDFDGPLLIHFRHRRGDNYIYYWCDCDAGFNRWMVLRISETNILRLVNRIVPLDFVIPKQCQDDFAYFIDIDAAGRTSRCTLIAISDVPAEYVPDAGAYLDLAAAMDPASYAVLIDGDWSLDTLSELPRRFSQVYAFLYALREMALSSMISHPWRGGFSAMHFYKWLAEIIPSEHRPQPRRISYASPGFIQFSLHRQTAGYVVKCMNTMSGKGSQSASLHSELEGYIRLNKLNELPESDPRWETTFNGPLLEYTNRMLFDLGIPDAEIESFVSAAPRPFEAAKIAKSFVTRLKQLAKYEHDGLAKYPRA